MLKRSLTDKIILFESPILTSVGTLPSVETVSSYRDFQRATDKRHAILGHL
jgi:hypothetical protein